MLRCLTVRSITELQSPQVVMSLCVCFLKSKEATGISGQRGEGGRIRMWARVDRERLC